MEENTNIVFLETDEEKNNALLYTAIFNEVQRLNVCKNKKERENIRKFILNGYQELKSSIGKFSSGK